ncbi:hypothetical protein LZ554_008878 [Drepanopeziza brunnea f. sp. 'monogermtubi']|nr:hypothetical protein LZ554_008878 [Drepanopeziza brunnea f. sp. 'monogermtubi']
MSTNDIVRHIRVVAHLSQDLGDGISENHWSTYLLLGGGASVRMNMTAEYGNPIGTLSVRVQSYHLTASALQYWDYAMVDGVTVKMVRDMIKSYGRDQYEFSGGGSGCRYWCYTILGDLQQQGYVPSGSYEHLWEQLQYQYSRSGQAREINWVQGTFIGI